MYLFVSILEYFCNSKQRYFKTNVLHYVTHLKTLGVTDVTFTVH